MADDPTLGELARNIKRIEDAQMKLATETVPAKLWAAEHQSLQNALGDHVRQSGVDHDRLERALTDLRVVHERDIKDLRVDLDKEIAQARGENKTQIEALRQEREKRSEFTWQRGVGLLTAAVALAGVIIAALAASKGIH